MVELKFYKNFVMCRFYN